MEGKGTAGEGSFQRKHQAERRSSRHRAEDPPVEEEVPEVEMEEEEEEETAPAVDVKEERKKRAKAMKSMAKSRVKSPEKRGQTKKAPAGFDPDNASARPAVICYRGGAGRRDIVAASRADATLSRPRKGEMRALVSWTLVLAAFLALPPFQRDRVEEMGFGEIFRIERMRVDPAITQALRSRWDTEANAFVFPWGHMIPILEDVSRITGLRVYGKAVSGYTYPSYHDIAERLLDLPVERESEDEYLERLARVSRRELASELGPQADLDLHRFLVLFLGRLLFATRGDAVHCRFLPLLADLGEVGGYAWGADFLAHQFDCLSASDRQTSSSGFYPFLQVWAYLHLPTLGRGDLTRPGLVPIARR
ncbi:hypothetical protein Taro_041520 [Colocasia esculenta]|uniref:Aminotransferase-like plant mobile domain-containing protein n=1 Tax=Colocasia esculenta TaxID=4460 RepID=A0A843WBP1_COLES|nr:hypothetical protein [Colocasia esculenta]